MAILVTTLKSAQAVTDFDIVEGKAVKLSTSGLRNDLPRIVLATANDVQGVFVAFMPVDDFSRPTPRALYRAPYFVKRNDWNNNAYGDPVENQTWDRIPRSMWKEPTVYSGELVALHRGVIGLTAGAFHDSAGIKVPGAMFRVGASGMWQVTATASEAVGIVRAYDSYNGVLYVDFNV